MVEVNYLFLLLATPLATAAPVTETDRTSDIVCAESLGRQKYGTKEILGISNKAVLERVSMPKF